MWMCGDCYDFVTAEPRLQRFVSQMQSEVLNTTHVLRLAQLLVSFLLTVCAAMQCWTIWSRVLLVKQCKISTS